MEITTDYIIFYGVTLIAVLIGLYGFSKFDAPLRLITIYILSSFIVETISSYYVYFCDPPQANLYLMNIFIFLEGILLLLYFRKIIKSKRVETAIRIASVSFSLFWIGSSFYHEGVGKELFVPMAGLVHFTLLLLIFKHFGELLETLQDTRIEFNPYFWINFGILLCVVVGITAVFCYWYLVSGSGVLVAVWSLVRYSRILLAVFISLGFFIHLRYGRN